MTEHLLLLLDVPVLTERATRAASAKASLTPRFRFAEHSVGKISSWSLDTLREKRVPRT